MLSGHPLPKEDGQLPVDCTPVLTPSCPFPGNVHHGQIQHLEQAVIGGEYGFGFRHLPELAVEAFNSIGGVDQLPDLLGILEIGAEIGPVLPPGLGDLRVFPVPALRERLQSIQSR